MRHSKILQLIVGCPVSCLLLASCAPTAPQDSSGAPVPISSYKEAYRIAPLDTIVVTHANGHIDTLAATVEDNLTFPGDEPLHVIGKTPDDVESTITERDSTIKSVEVTEFKGNRISVTGEVNLQTNFDLQDAPMRVMDAIASAGGFTPLADASSVRLTRHSSGTVQVFELNMKDVQEGKNFYLNMLLKPGDQIFVPKNFL